MRRRSRPYRVSARGERARRFSDIGAATRAAKELAKQRGEAVITLVGGYRSGTTAYRFVRADDGTIRIAHAWGKTFAVEERR